MKKILFASTALVATAGVAAAEVSFSGAAGMGFGYVDGRTATTTARTVDATTGVVTYTQTTAPANEWKTISFATLSVSMTGETDGGLSFGADFDITAGEDTIDSAVVYIEGGFGKLSAGDVDSASQTVTGLSDIGFDGLGTDNVAEVLRGSDERFATFGGISADLLYEKSMGDFGFAVSYSLSAETLSVGAKYDNGNYSFGVGYDDFAATGVVHVQAGVNIADFDVDALYSTTTDSAALDLKSYGVTAAYNMNAVTVTAAYSNADLTAAAVADSVGVEIFGLGVSYDLGGGASLDAGVAEVTTTLAGVSTSSTVADLGINMSF